MTRSRICGFGVGVVALVLGSVQWAGAQQAPQPASANALSMARLKEIKYEDLDKLNTSGCSFSLMRGKQQIAFLDIEAEGKNKPGFKPSFWFKLDGKLVQVSGEAKKANKDQWLGAWSGKLDGQDVRITEGKRDPKFKSDGGGQGGAAQIEWPGATGPVSTAVKWEAGC